MDRLQKIIAASGLTSRRKAEEWILQGRVKVDGQVVTELGVKPRKGALIEVDGKAIAREDKVYYVMNKPKKVLCTLNDEHDRRTVVDLMTDVPQRVFPVGRLDYDTTGVLIMTNDGEFANEIIHPRYHIAKVYEVTINGILKTEEIKHLIEPILTEHHLFLVELKISKDNVIEVFVDALEGVNIQTCIAVSREIESSLNRDEEDFELTVSSAGIGYPFKVEQQYQKNLGKSVEIKLNDHTKLNGILLRFTPEEIVIEQEEKKIIEGSKRKQLVKTERTIVRKDIKEIKDVVKF